MRTRRHEIASTGTVHAARDDVFAFLAVLENHWRLSPAFDVLQLDRDADGAARGATVRVNGPLGLHRTVDTRVLELDPPRAMCGEGVAQGTRGEVRWRLDPAGDATRVELRVAVTSPTWADRVLLTFGGRWWLRRQFAAIIRELGRQVGVAAGPGAG